eukprot:gene47025-57585_t
MSRFALPVDRSVPPNVARSPSIPEQKQPGHRYGRGMVLPGASMKGRHVIEVRIQGTTRQRATSPHREELLLEDDEALPLDDNMSISSKGSRISRGLSRSSRLSARGVDQGDGYYNNPVISLRSAPGRQQQQGGTGGAGPASLASLRSRSQSPSGSSTVTTGTGLLSHLSSARPFQPPPRTER